MPTIEIEGTPVQDIPGFFPGGDRATFTFDLPTFVAGTNVISMGCKYWTDGGSVPHPGHMYYYGEPLPFDAGSVTYSGYDTYTLNANLPLWMYGGTALTSPVHDTATTVTPDLDAISGLHMSLVINYTGSIAAEPDPPLVGFRGPFPGPFGLTGIPPEVAAALVYVFYCELLADATQAELLEDATDGELMDDATQAELLE